MRLNFYNLLFVIAWFSLMSFACDKKDGVVVVSNHLSKDSLIFDSVRKSEVLAKRKEWREAAVILKGLYQNLSNDCLSCGAEINLVLGYAYVLYLFNEKSDDSGIPDIINDLLIENLNDNCFKPFCAELYRLLMAYYWSLGDIKLHDETLRNLVLYDKNSEFDFINLLYACLERNTCRSSMKQFLKIYEGKKNEIYDFALLFYSDLTEKDIKFGIINWLRTNYDSRGFVVRCFLAHVANFLSCDDLDFVYLYCSELNNWLKNQKDDEDRKEIMTSVLSERYRIQAVLDLSPN